MGAHAGSVGRGGLLAFGLALSFCVVACGDDTSSGGTADAGGAGTGAGSGAGSGGAGAGGAGSGSTYDGTCGGVSCPAAMAGISEGCCTAEGTGVSGDPLELTGRAANLCGVDLGAVVPTLAGTCLQLNQPGTPNSDCPTVSNGFADEAGCCTDEGFCGTLSASVGLGCHYPASGRGMACSGSGNDGGSEDAGH